MPQFQKGAAHTVHCKRESLWQKVVKFKDLFPHSQSYLWLKLELQSRITDLGLKSSSIMKELLEYKATYG